MRFCFGQFFNGLQQQFIEPQGVNGNFVFFEIKLGQFQQPVVQFAEALDVFQHRLQDGFVRLRLPLLEQGHLDLAGDGRKGGPGKQVLELHPALDWHKGKAVTWIMEALRMDPNKAVPIYLGDDLADEEAFRTIRETGVGIRVGGPGEPTEAVYHLEDTGQVEQLLRIAVQFIRK